MLGFSVTVHALKDRRPWFSPCTFTDRLGRGLRTRTILHRHFLLLKAKLRSGEPRAEEPST